MDPKFFSLLGLAMRAGKVVSGEEQVINVVRKKKAFLVIVADDASENTKKRIKDKTTHYGVPCVIAGNRHQLGQAIGKDERVLLAVTDQGFAQGLSRFEGVHYLGVML
jgi:ribosomal protein L7Ae-like RNA K-turn-binding protein